MGRLVKQVLCVINLHAKTMAVVWTKRMDSNVFAWMDLLDLDAKQKSMFVHQWCVHHKQIVLLNHLVIIFVPVSLKMIK
jgi:hypothetical protein